MSDDLEAVVADYPTVATPIVKEIRSLHSAILRQGAEVERVKGDIENRRRQEIEAAHFSAIKKVHSDLDAINASDDFQGWLSRQSGLIQRAATEGDAKEVIDVLNRYKAAVGIGVRQKKLKFTRAQINSMSPEEFERREKEIDEAMANGEIA